MTDQALALPPKCERRVQAVLALFRGEAVGQVSTRYRICRSDLYKFQRRALDAMRDALTAAKRGPRTPHNRLAPAQEEAIRIICERHPTLSSAEVRGRLHPDALSARTVQRVRHRLHLPRLPKRDTPACKAHRFTDDERQLIRHTVASKLSLGPYRLAWDLQNQHGLQISPSTTRRVKRALLDERHPRPAPAVWRFYERHHPHSLWHGDFLEKVTLTDLDRTAYQLTLLDDYSRGYVYCDVFLEPDMRTTVRALIAAMRQWQVIPKAVVVDNGAPFKGRLLVAFCKHVEIRLIHSAVNHPQTNGKLERAFRDDMRDFYRQYDGWILEPLRKELPAYVHYRNYIRGHQALGGKPSITRLNEQDQFAPQELLDRLESFAWCEVKRKVVSRYGYIPMFGRIAYVGRVWRERELTFVETLEGLEAHAEGRCVAIMRDYWKYRKLQTWRWRTIPPRLYFKPYERVSCPRMAVAS